MKVIFDHNVPARLRPHLGDHEVYTAGWLGWNHLSNGELIVASEAAYFDILLTGDQNLVYQQNNAKRTIALIVLSRIDWPAPLYSLEKILSALGRCTRGSFEFVELPQRER